jgi:hypothetical protein
MIAFDADAGAKDQVRFARAELAQYLKRKGANIGFYEWDLARGKGIDDHLASVWSGSYAWMKSHVYLSTLSIGAKS